MKVTEAIYFEVQNKCENLGKERRVSVSVMLYILGVSRSRYNSWLHHLTSNQQKRKKLIKDKIKEIYDKSHQNYGAPKIAKEIQKTGEKISERTVGKYMKELGIKAHIYKTIYCHYQKF
ncbi:IS3 family transposase [Clostridium hydrogenum]|uniref:IS3 family transposase n=1 Tax=Clostridium hydrogenum TaxID=2855764 RepID=UPI002E30D418|nr:IS3 family transposase [Clostridium hydrogenum]